MASFATLFCLFIYLVSCVRGDVLYVVGDEVVSVTDQGFVGLSGTKTSCAGSNTAKAMASYIAGPNTVVVPVTVSLCGSFLSSDVLAGLDWIDGDIDYGATNHIAIGVNLDKAGTTASVINTHVASFLANRAVVSTVQGYWSNAPKGVLLVPDSTPRPNSTGVSPSPPPQCPPKVCPPPSPIEPPGPCNPVWKNVVIGESAVVGAFIVCACFVLGVWHALRRTPAVATVPRSYTSQSQLGIRMYPAYQNESLRMPPFVGAKLPDRDALSTPDIAHHSRPMPQRETASSPDVLTTKWVPDTSNWGHVPTPYHKTSDGPYGDLGMDGPDPPARVSISMSGIRDVQVRRSNRQNMFDAVDEAGKADKDTKIKFDFRPKPGTPDTMSSSRETPQNLSERDQMSNLSDRALSKRGSV